MSKKIILTSFVILLLCIQAQAHRPIFTDEKGTGPKTAVKIENPDISQVIYRVLSKETPQLWLAIDSEKEYELFVQIGIPVIEKYKNFRPSFAVVGPGLPEIILPFALPENTGAREFPTLEITEPRFFHEHFTKTDSWILLSEKVFLPQSGRYYVVVYSPVSEKGKFWVSVGEKESFGFWDLFRFGGWKKAIRKFHETDSKPKAIQSNGPKKNWYTRKYPRKLPGHRR